MHLAISTIGALRSGDCAIIMSMRHCLFVIAFLAGVVLVAFMARCAYGAIAENPPSPRAMRAVPTSPRTPAKLSPLSRRTRRRFCSSSPRTAARICRRGGNTARFHCRNVAYRKMIDIPPDVM